MKQSILVIALLAVLFVACSEEQQPISPTPETQTQSKIRTPEEAAKVAQALIDAKFGVQTRSSQVEIQDVEVVGNQASRSNSDTLIYAVNFSDNQGFALVSASYEGVDLLGYTDSGTFDESEINEESGFSYFMDAAKDYVLDNLSIGDVPTKPGRDPSTYIKIIHHVAGPHLEVEWGQKYPEGLYCMNGISGCVQTACAQIMSYIKEPASIVLTYPNRDKDTETLDWDVILQHKTSSMTYCYCEGGREVHLTIARLCRELGYRNNAVYYEDSTGATIDAAHQTMSALYPGRVSSIKPFNSPYNSLLGLDDKKSIVYMRGQDSTYGGHAWVCDGVEKIGTATYVQYEGNPEPVLKEDAPTYFHFNWGFCGSYNGWFAAGVFEVENPAKVKSRSGYNFRNNVQYFSVSK